MLDRRTGLTGLLLAVVSAAAFGTSGVFATALLDAGWTAGSAVTARMAVASLALAVPAVVALRGRWSLLRSNAGAVLAFGALAVALPQLAYFNAVSRLSVGVALLLEYSGVLLVVLWTWARLGQRPSRVTGIGVVVAIVGLVLVLDVVGGARIDPVGVVWGLVAAVGLASYFVLSAHSDDALPPLVSAWAGLAVGALVLGAAALVGAIPWRTTAVDVELAGRSVSWLVPVLGLALLAAAFAYATGIAAVRRLGSRLSSFVGLSEVLFAVAAAWLALGQQPAVVQLVGGVVVLAGIVLVRLGEEPPAAVAGVDPVPAGAEEETPAPAAGPGQQTPTSKERSGTVNRQP
ncbi:EamA family transporter [Modestobacter versicolor]|uniref:Drug/metabolite transporter (DMT)-like permease n=1 Tax=Modestobacter versicolor TaxID=429133 RepID=A0A323V9Q3_9ACTN|nr:DMT family transporter [Modestobacter versicolor]MBB3676859.1 drug/metabolite transporter (DMT)-like permease [Modestobacter versicolor]PZA20006.1 EamA/RhaT family transporter [Modestobacter versicolor]